MLLQARAEKEAVASASEEAPVEKCAEEELGREADEDKILLNATRRRWGRSKSRDDKCGSKARAATPTGARWRTNSRDRLPKKSSVTASIAAAKVSADVNESGSDSDALALELCVEAEEEMEREEREDEEGFW
eukprot:gb/GFBE01029313.1/.p1 GENE.gb/GFBE01029313.1/~~gb/GFBE01029313.1/.p1  ORF type:complete len:133 (+),score=32.75 gb/GFBE01029313.1/:1-399(+)